MKNLAELQALTKQGKIRVMYYYIGKTQKILAIKMCREISGMGLKESKDWVEAEMESLAKFTHNP